MTRKQLAVSLFLALANASCATRTCEIENAMEIVLPGDAECPAVAQAQAELDHRPEKHAGEVVVRISEQALRPAATLCWYRMDLDLRCVEASRAEVGSQPSPQTDVVACDAQGWLYGQVSPGGADECPATIAPERVILPFFDADEFPERTECRYDTRFTEQCTDTGTIPTFD